MHSQFSNCTNVSDSLSDTGTSISNVTKTSVVTVRPTPRTWSRIQSEGHARIPDVNIRTSNSSRVHSRAESPVGIRLEKQSVRGRAGSSAKSFRTQLRLPAESMIFGQKSHPESDAHDDMLDVGEEDIRNGNPLLKSMASQQHSRKDGAGSVPLIRSAVNNSCIASDTGFPVVSRPSSATTFIASGRKARKVGNDPTLSSRSISRNTDAGLANKHDFRSRPSSAGTMYRRLVRTSGFGCSIGLY